MSLPPLPPGADPSTTPSLPPAAIRSSDAPALAGPPRRSKPETRPLHEPEFVVAAGTAMLQPHSIEDEPAEPVRRRLPWALLALVLVAGAAGGLQAAMRTDHAEVAVARDATARGDATLIAEVHDAGAILDDAELLTGLTADAGVHSVHRDAGVIVATGSGGDPPKTVTVEILTRPGDAGVFVGHDYRGPSGVHLAAPYGTKLTIDSHAPHYKPGVVKVVFDGRRSR